MKPQNIIVDPEAQRLRLIDLGSAADLKAPLGGSGRYIPGVLPGSPLFAAPEEAIDWQHPYKFDVFGVALIVWQCAFEARGTQNDYSGGGGGGGSLSEVQQDMEERLDLFRQQLQLAGGDLDRWLAGILGTTLVEQRVMHGLGRFKGEGRFVWRALNKMLASEPSARRSVLSFLPTAD